MLDEKNKPPMSWEEVAAVFNYREGLNMQPGTIKEIGLSALRKLRARLKDKNIKYEDMTNK